MEEEYIKKLKQKLIGKKLNSIIYLEINNDLSSWIKSKFELNDYNNIDMAQILIFDDIFLLFVDLDCDGYRSGNWFVKDFSTFAKRFLDKNHTREIKIINSIIQDVVFYENAKSINGYNEDNEFLIIETKDYIIEMGQNNCSDYYPSNFFNIQEIKDLIIQKRFIKK